MKALLERWGVKVTAAGSSREAAALNGAWDVIRSDYQLGEDMDGLDLIETMRARAQVFALLVASPTEAVLQRAADLGCGNGRKARRADCVAHVAGPRAAGKAVTTNSR